MRRWCCAILGLVCALLALNFPSAQAAYHLWDISEIYTNQDGTVQFIELQTPVTANGENSLFGHTLRATSTVAGVPTVVTFNFPNSNPVGFTGGKNLLIATSTFGPLPGAVQPDYTTLPANFFNPNASIITFNFAENSDTVTFVGGSIPKDGRNSVSDSNLFGVANFVSGVNSPTNFATMSGSINLATVNPTGDYNGDHVVNAADYTVWRNSFGQPASPAGSGADGDGTGTIGNGDFNFWAMHYGEVVSGAGGGAVAVVPEPPICTLLLQCLVLLFGAGATNRHLR